MNEEASSPISVIRSAKRSDLRDLRSKHKELVLSNKRLRLNDVSEYVHDVTLSEFNELLLKLKQKFVPLSLLRKIKNSCVSPEYIEAVLRNDGAFNALIRIFIGNDAQKQLEAAACLTNIACGSHKCSYKVAKTSGPYLVSFLNGSSHFLQEQSAWALANIANDCLECFNIIKAHGVLPALLKALQSPLPSVTQCVVFSLNACTQYEEPEVISAIQSNLIKRLLFLLEEDHLESAFLDAAFTLTNCCFLSAKYSLSCIEITDTERILILLQKITSNAEKNANILITPLLRCLGFLSYDDRICEFVALQPGFFEIIPILASKGDGMQLLKEAIWVLTNVIAGVSKFNISYLMPIIDSLEVTLKLENSMVLLVLYFLSVSATKEESLSLFIKQHNILIQIQSLLEKMHQDVSEAVTVFLKIVK